MTRRPERARYAVADVRRLPEPDGRFDAALAAKLFQHVGRWELGIREIVRVLKRGACLFLIDERGAKNPVRETFARLLAEAGVSARLPGTRDPAEIAAALVAEGCREEPFDASGLTWTAGGRLGEALDQLEERTSAEFWSVPDDVYDRVLAATAEWVMGQPGGRDAEAETQPRLSVQVFRKAA